MQLFITEFQHSGSKIILSNTDVISQIKKVLRMRIGDIFSIQSPNLPIIRYCVKIIERDDKQIVGEIQDEEVYNSSDIEKTMIIAMPNKREKAELIAQKLTEIGIQNIVFRPSERSVIKERNEKKAERIFKIIKEAVEQSRGRKLPTINFTKNISEVIGDNKVVVFDISREGLSFDEGNEWKNVGLIGPEGGLTDLDYINLQSEKVSIKSLGSSVLRMETAAIIGGRFLKNIQK